MVEVPTLLVTSEALAMAAASKIAATDKFFNIVAVRSKSVESLPSSPWGHPPLLYTQSSFVILIRYLPNKEGEQPIIFKRLIDL